MPGVEDGVAALGHEEHAEVGLTGSEHARPTIFVHQAHEMEIVGKFAAGHERPAATQPEPTFRGHGLSGRSCGAREQPTGVAEYPCAPRVIQEAGPETRQRVIPNEPGHRRFGARHVSRTLNHSSGVYGGGAPVSRSMRHKSLFRIACTIGSAIRRSFSVVWRSSRISGIRLSAKVTISLILSSAEFLRFDD